MYGLRPYQSGWPISHGVDLHRRACTIRVGGDKDAPMNDDLIEALVQASREFDGTSPDVVSRRASPSPACTEVQDYSIQAGDGCDAAALQKANHGFALQRGIESDSTS